MTRSFVLTLALLPLGPAHACLWDRDTLAMEAAGLPDVPRVATGRFPRSPPAYYEMRHRWLRAGMDPADLADLRAAVTELKAALVIDPEAHFGRERYQLEAIEYLLDPASREGPVRPFVRPEMPDEAEKAVRGLSGLVVLGAAWESVDVFHALQASLGRAGHASLQTLAQARLRALVDGGKRSAARPELAGADLVGRLSDTYTALEEPKHVAEWFRVAGVEAAGWHARRTAYMQARLARGEHPDTHDGFWSEWDDGAPPAFPGDASRVRDILAAVAVALLLAALLGVSMRRRRAATRPARS